MYKLFICNVNTVNQKNICHRKFLVIKILMQHVFIVSIIAEIFIFDRMTIHYIAICIHIGS